MPAPLRSDDDGHVGPSIACHSSGVSYTRAMDPRHASASLSKWGLVQGWLAGDPARRVEVRAVSSGLAVRIVDPSSGDRTADIGLNEDPSAAAWRAIVLLNRGA